MDCAEYANIECEGKITQFLRLRILAILFHYAAIPFTVERMTCVHCTCQSQCITNTIPTVNFVVAIPVLVLAGLIAFSTFGSDLPLDRMALEKE